MSKQVLILSSSLREHSNSDMMADAFAEGARAAGHDVEKIRLSGKEIRFCQGCLACQNTKRCVIHDDADDIVQNHMLGADVLVFSTPIYYYEMSGQMKTLLDRANPLYSANYRFREVYLLAAAAEEEDSAWKRAASGLEGWIECFPEAKLCGAVFGGGYTQAGSIRDSACLQKACEAGKSL